MKSAKPYKWAWRVFIILVFIGFVYGYITERAQRIKVEEAARTLLIVHDNELGEYRTLLNSMTIKQIEQTNRIHGLTGGVIQMQRSIYEMYHELRKYRKDLPPWGGEYKPMDPEDKWTKNDT